MARARRILRWTAGGVSLALLAGAASTRVLAHRAEKTYPRLGEIVRVDGVRQHVLDRGTGRPIVFVHGAFGGLQDFAATVLGPASERYRCVLWDRPGHGYSERPPASERPLGPGAQAEILLALVRQMELERPLLVGFSYGGAVCLAAALAAPEELAGVVLVNGPSHPWPDPLDLAYRLGGVPVLGRLLSETFAAPAGYVLGGGGIERAFDPLPVPASFAQSPVPLALRPASYRANMEDVRLLKPFLAEQSRRYPELRSPVVALVGTGDRVVSPTIHVPQLVTQAPHVRQIRVEGAGHQMLYTHTDLVLATIDEAMVE